VLWIAGLFHLPGLHVALARHSAKGDVHRATFELIRRGFDHRKAVHFALVDQQLENQAFLERESRYLVCHGSTFHRSISLLRSESGAKAITADQKDQ
jgi:hypothetical protein